MGGGTDLSALPEAMLENLIGTIILLTLLAVVGTVAPIVGSEVAGTQFEKGFVSITTGAILAVGIFGAIGLFGFPVLIIRLLPVQS